MMLLYLYQFDTRVIKMETGREERGGSGFRTLMVLEERIGKSV